MLNSIKLFKMELEKNSFNEMQTVKRHFFAMRNGVIADTLRRGGSPFKIIFGLNLPQIVEIAQSTPHSAELAQKLWSNSSTRESMLIAPMLYPREDFNLNIALEWTSQIPTTEVADILCHRLLRHVPFSLELAHILCDSKEDLKRYTGLRLFFNIVSIHPKDALEHAEQELKSPTTLTRYIAIQLAEEANFCLS